MSAPRDIFAEQNIKVDKPPIDIFAERGIKPTSFSNAKQKNHSEFLKFKEPSRGQQRQQGQSLIDFGKGASQSYINTAEEAANAFGKHLYNKFDYAPKNEAANIGGIAGDIGSFVMPSNAISATLKAASLIPKAGKYVKGAQEAVRSKPIVNALKNIGLTTGEAALFQAEKNPKSKPIDIAKAGTIGGGLSLAANSLANQNPIIRTAAKLGLGGGLGYQFGGAKGAAEGMAASMFIPKGLREMGLGKSPLSYEILTQEPNAQAVAKYKAGRRIGDVGTPAEVFDNPVMGSRQGNISHTEAGAQAMTDFGRGRIAKQQNAINSLLNKIFPNTESAHNKITSLYKHSYENNLSANAMHELIEDPVFAQASKNVFNDPAYAKDLKNIRSDNYAYLDQVKRSLDDMSQSAIKAGENNKARIYQDTTKKLTDMMDQEAPVYKQARQASQNKIIHRDIMKRLNKKEITGKNFYKEFLSNENKFNDILNEVKNIPGAQQKLKDMRTSWNNLIGFDTPATAAGMASKHTSKPREHFQKFWTEFKEMFGSPRDVERAKFIHDPKWWSKFDEVIKYKNKLDRQKALSDLIATGISAGTLEAFKEKQKNK